MSRNICSDLSVSELVIESLLFHHLKELFILHVFSIDHHLLSLKPFHVLIIVVFISSISEYILPFSILIFYVLSISFFIFIVLKCLNKIYISLFILLLDVLLGFLVSDYLR